MDKKFCAEAAEAGFVNLKGHRLVGGMRASIYNVFTTRGNEWIACLTIAAILELYTAFRIPQEEEKERA